MARLPLMPLQRTLLAGAASGIGIFLLFLAIERFVGSGDLSEFPPLTARPAASERLIVDHPARLARLFDDVGYTLAAIRRGDAPVPAMMLRTLPPAFRDIEPPKARKRTFIRTVLPLVLEVNRRIADQRRVLLALLEKRRAGQNLGHREERWLEHLARFYRTTPDDATTLRRRVAQIPPSLAIAQAAVESGWGTSRFALQGNALFGQWTFSRGAGLRPEEADKDSRHAVKRYDRLIDSAWDYGRNINTHPVYRSLREARARGVRSGTALAAHLGRYSEKGPLYVDLLRNLIAHNRLEALNKARLAAPASP